MTTIFASLFSLDPGLKFIGRVACMYEEARDDETVNILYIEWLGSGSGSREGDEDSQFVLSELPSSESKRSAMVRVDRIIAQRHLQPHFPHIEKMKIFDKTGFVTFAPVKKLNNFAFYRFNE